MTSIPIQPVDSLSEHGTLQLGLFFRIKVLDIATGEPVTDAYAIQPAIDQKIMDRLARHPFRVTKETKIQLGWDEGGKEYRFKQKFKTLRRCINGSQFGFPTKYINTWERVPEFFHRNDISIPSLLDGQGNVYEPVHPVHGGDEKLVCVKKEGEDLANRDLITNLDGILEIPVSVQDIASGKEVTIEFRDYFCAVADGLFSPGAAREKIRVLLESSPIDNKWVMKAGRGGTRKFEKSISQKIVSFLDRKRIGLTLWVVRKAKEYDGNPEVKTNHRRDMKKIRGIMIHFNSGLNINEQRGWKTVTVNNLPGGATQLRKPKWCKLREAFDHDENDYMVRSSEMALEILGAVWGKNTSIGYHYHIERDGEIVWVVDEENQTGHAGESREKETVNAEENVAPGPLPAKIVTEVLKSPAENLNSQYIGIDLIGNNKQPKYYFTERQIWYLDRLIENIMARRSEVKWYYIQGHDEVRNAYKEKYPTKKIDSKPDPGAALPGGMDRLRGRHYGLFI